MLPIFLTPQIQFAYSTKQVLSWSLKKVNNHLPHSSRKNVWIIPTWHPSIKYESKWMKIVVAQERDFLKKKMLEWLIGFLSRSDVTYTKHEKGGWWAKLFAPSIPIIDSKGFIGDYQWNQRVNFTRFFQFCIFFLGEANFF